MRKEDPRIKNVIVNIKKELRRMEVENIIEGADKAQHRKLLPEDSQRMPTDLTESETYFSIRQKYLPDEE